MPVLAVPGAAVPAPASAAVTAAALPAAPAPVASGSRAADPMDVVSLSPAALMQQALDAPVLAMRRLDGLLQEFEQIAGLTRAAAPRVLGTLAGDIGGAAHDLGAGVRTLLPGADTPTPLQLGAAATLRVLATLAPAVTAPPDTRVADGHAADPHSPGGHPGDTPPPVAMPTDDARPVPGPASPSATPRPAPQAATPAAAPPAALASPYPGRLAPAPHDFAPHDPARPGPTNPDLARPAADLLRPALLRLDPARQDSARQDPARQDPARQAREAVVALLDEATATLGRIQLRLHAAPAPPLADAGRDEAWCEAQIAAALGSVAQASRAVAGTRPAGPAGIAALFAARAATPQGAGQAVRPGRVALLCCLGLALWAAQTLDLGVARTLTAVSLGVAALAWAWRHVAWRRVRVEMRR